MTKYEELLQSAYDNGHFVIEHFDFTKCTDKLSNIEGLATKEGILLSDKLKDDRHRKCVLAEEIAHRKYSTGNITDLSLVSNHRQEVKAHKEAVYNLVPFKKLVDTVIELRYESDIYTVAFELDVTEEFLLEAIKYYSLKYGPVVDYGSYIVYFNPFHVLEKQKI